MRVVGCRVSFRVSARILGDGEEIGDIHVHTERFDTHWGNQRLGQCVAERYVAQAKERSVLEESAAGKTVVVASVGIGQCRCLGDVGDVAWLLPSVHLAFQESPVCAAHAAMLLEEPVHVEYVVSYREIEEERQVEIFVSQSVSQAAGEVWPGVATYLSVGHGYLAVVIYVLIDSVSGLGVYI